MTRVAISNAVLSWAMERSGAPETVKQRFPKLSEWLQGQSQPTLRQLEEFAKATYTPLGYLFLSVPPEEQITIPHFRTLSDEPLHRPSPDLIETVQTMEQDKSWIREYLIEIGQEPLAFVHSARPTYEPEKIAKDIRHVLGLTDLWASEQKTCTDALKKLLIMTDEAGDTRGCEWHCRKQHSSQIGPSRISWLCADRRVRTFYFHQWCGWQSSSDVHWHTSWLMSGLGAALSSTFGRCKPANDETEQACKLIAAEFLVPEAEFREVWPFVQQDPDRFQKIARHFKVSEIVAARRVLDLQGITRSEFHDFYIDHMKRTTGQQGGDFYANQKLRAGRRFGETVVRAAREGKLLYRDAYRLTGLHGKNL